MDGPRWPKGWWWCLRFIRICRIYGGGALVTHFVTSGKVGLANVSANHLCRRAALEVGTPSSVEMQRVSVTSGGVADTTPVVRIPTRCGKIHEVPEKTFRQRRVIRKYRLPDSFYGRKRTILVSVEIGFTKF